MAAVRTAWALGAIVLAVWLVTEPTLDYGFAYDDRAVVLERPPAWQQGWRAFFETRGWGVGRHAALLSLDLDRREPLSPRPFRLTNASLAAVNAALLLALARALGMASGGALAAALLFAVHPAHVDAVTSIVGRAELLAALGVLAALNLHARAYGGRVHVALAAGLAFFLALASKESAVSLVALIACYEVFRPGDSQAVAGAAPSRPLSWPLPYLLAAAAWLLLVADNFGSVEPIVYADNPLAHLPAWQRMLGGGEVLWRYYAAALWPFGLRPDLGYAEVTTTTGGGALAWAGWLALGGAALALRRRAPLAGFAALWLPAAFVVTANVLIPIGALMAERLLYLPSAGVCLLAGAAFDRAASAPRALRAARYVGLFLALLALALAYHQRARVWASDEHYHEQAALLSPRSAKAHFNFGLSLARQGRHEEAEKEFGRALAILPRFAEAAVYRAEALRRLGRLEDAVATYDGYLETVPGDAAAWRASAELAEAAGDRAGALERLRRAVETDPEDAEARAALVEMEARARAGALNP